jgi:hypothetical protein
MGNTSLYIILIIIYSLYSSACALSGSALVSINGSIFISAQAWDVAIVPNPSTGMYNFNWTGAASKAVNLAK